MSEQTHTNSRALPVVEILSDEDSDSPRTNTHDATESRNDCIIEIPSDVSEDDVEIVAENSSRRDSGDVQITGQTSIDLPIYEIDYPNAPPRPQVSRGGPLRRPFSGEHRESTSNRNVRRRPNPPLRHLFLPPRFNPRIGHSLANYDGYHAMLEENQRHLLQFFRSREGEISSAIMERISRDEESSLDRKMESENNHNRKVLEQKKGVANEELEGYTNNIAPEDNIMCELCGIVLGEGIPGDFEPSSKYDEELEKHASISKVMAPWYCVRQCFSTDKELSKRVFAAKCGHVFCGRCIKNIGSRPPARRGKNSNEITILNPQISAPRKCPAEGCGMAFNKSKKTFTELFL